PRLAPRFGASAERPSKRQRLSVPRGICQDGGEGSREAVWVRPVRAPPDRALGPTPIGGQRGLGPAFARGRHRARGDDAPGRRPGGGEDDARQDPPPRRAVPRASSAVAQSTPPPVSAQPSATPGVNRPPSRATPRMSVVMGTSWLTAPAVAAPT